MDVRRGFADVNGTRLYYEVAGTGDPLVLIHGFSLDTRMWDDQFTPFAERHRVVRYDVRGFGKSAPFGGAPYTHADDLAALLFHLDIPHAAILGLSMGGGIAVNFALDHPAMTRALIPVDSTLGGRGWSDAFAGPFNHVGHVARTVGIDAGKEEWLNHALFVPANERSDVAERLRQMIGDYSGWHWSNRDPQRGLDPPAAERLREITAPTLVMLGERDLPDFHFIADGIVEQVSGARKIVLPGVGHMANMEAPERFNTEVLGFLADIR
ncbi:MAG: alpha/beta fold hydrolase [Thermomicrobia bacterium]|nr:alpha/beta fold hydrolase [Thermomicrobia bacterium]MCA1723084.1 alpha/beta fold hydrolase [Thermomicrobia bacterium]